MLNRWRAARTCGCRCTPHERASEKSNIRMWWVWMGIRPLRGRDSVCPLSAGSLRSPAVRQDSGLSEAVGLAAFRYTFIIYRGLSGRIPPRVARQKAGTGMACPRMSPPVPVWIVRNGCGWIPTARRRPHSGLRPCLIEIAGIVLQKEEHRQDPIPNKTHR